MGVKPDFSDDVNGHSVCVNKAQLIYSSMHERLENICQW